MNDEPIAIFNDVIDQVTVGHEWLREHFGNRGRVRHGWQVIILILSLFFFSKSD